MKQRYDSGTMLLFHFRADLTVYLTMRSENLSSEFGVGHNRERRPLAAVLEFNFPLRSNAAMRYEEKISPRGRGSLTSFGMPHYETPRRASRITA